MKISYPFASFNFPQKTINFFFGIFLKLLVLTPGYKTKLFFLYVLKSS